jgi:hypothetical protein
MFPECWLMHAELNTFNRIGVNKMCVIIAAKLFGLAKRLQRTLPHFQEPMPIM